MLNTKATSSTLYFLHAKLLFYQTSQVLHKYRLFASPPKNLLHLLTVSCNIYSYQGTSTFAGFFISCILVLNKMSFYHKITIFFANNFKSLLILSFKSYANFEYCPCSVFEMCSLMFSHFTSVIY